MPHQKSGSEQILSYSTPIDLAEASHIWEAICYTQPACPKPTFIYIPRVNV